MIFFFHIIGNFHIGDKAFFINRRSRYYKNTKMSSLVLYSDKIEVSFQENDIVPITLNFEDILDKEAMQGYRILWV